MNVTLTTTTGTKESLEAGVKAFRERQAPPSDPSRGPISASSATPPAPGDPAPTTPQEPAAVIPPNTDGAPPTPEQDAPKPVAAAPDDSEDEAPKPGETSEQAKSRVTSRRQKRVNELIRDRTEAELKAAEATGRAKALEDQLQAARAGTPPGDGHPVPAAIPASPPAGDTFAETRPMPKFADFEDPDVWAKDISDWQLEQQAARRQFDEAQAARAQRQTDTITKWNTSVAKAKAAHADWDTVTATTFPASVDMQAEIMASDLGGELAYYLVTHPEEAAAMRAMPLAQMQRVLGRLEAKLEGTVGQPVPVPTSIPATPPSKPVVTTQAPPPPEPTRGAVSPSNLSLEELAKRGLTREWLVKRRAQRIEQMRSG